MMIGPYLARVLSTTYYGEFNRAASIVSWFVPFASFGIYNYGIRAISKAKNDEKQLSYLFTCLFFIGVFSGLMTSIIYIGYVYFTVDVSLMALYLVLGVQIFTQFCCVEWMNEAFENYGFILVKTFLIRLLNLVAVFIFVKEAHDIVPYAWIISFVNLANYLVSFVYVKKNVHFVKVHLPDLKKLLVPLISMLLLANSNMLYTALDRLFLSMQSQGEYITYYTFSVTITQVITQVINSIVIVTIPRLSNYLGEHREKDYYDLLDKSSRIFFMLGIPLCVGLACLGKSAIFLYGGEEYLLASTTLSIFGIRTLLWLADQSMNYQVIFPYGHERKLTVIYVACGCINLLLDGLLFAFHIYQPEYYVITTMISEIFVVGLDIRLIKKYIDPRAITVNHQFFKYLWVSLTFVPITMMFKWVCHYQYQLNLSFIMTTLVMVITCVIVYFAILFGLKDTILWDIYAKMKKKWAK